MTKRQLEVVSSVPAPTYQPTDREREALSQRQARKAARIPAPRLKVEHSGERILKIDLDHPDKSQGQSVGYKLLAEAIGATDLAFLDGMLEQIANAVKLENTVREDDVNFVLAVVKGIQPKDEIESMLAAQMAIVHMTTMRYGLLFGATKTQDGRTEIERGLNRLARTFAAQAEALKRYRSKGEQRIYVERVNVEDGGQAIVGAVSSDRGRG